MLALEPSLLWVLNAAAGTFLGRGLQEVNRNLAADTKIAVVSELLDVLDDLERGARLDAPDTGSSGQTLATLAKKFESRPVDERLKNMLGQPAFSRLFALVPDFKGIEHCCEICFPCAVCAVLTALYLFLSMVAIYSFLDSMKPKAEVHDS